MNSLSKVGSFLLISLGWVVVSGLASSPPARAISYAYVQEGSPLSYSRGTSQPDPLWSDPDFVETADWVGSAAGFGIGYGDGDDSTVLTDMQNSYVTVYVRSTFDVGAELASLTHLELDAWYDDGFVAYLNGVEIARASVPAGPLSFDTLASSHEASGGEDVFTVDPALLVPGQNVLAVEVHNTTYGSSDLSFIPTLWGYDTPPEDVEITVGPYLQRVGRRGAVLCWETDFPAISQVSFGTGQSLDQLLEDPTETTRHELAISGLLPGHEYSYRVESARLPSDTGRLRTETDAAEPYRFVIFGDTRSNHDDHRAVVNRIVASEPAFVVHSGDLVGDGSSDGNWTTFFDVERPLLRDVPLYPVLGNHEGEGTRYLELFVLPDDTSPGVENYYAFRYATSAFLMLDLYRSGFSAGSTQYQWIETTLQAWADDPSVHLRFVALHHGPYDSGSHGSNLTVRDDLAPLFESYGVDAVFSGHDHDYERGTVNGVKYVVAGGGGAPLYAVSGDWWTQVAEAVLHYIVVDVQGPRAELVVYREDGTVLDQFTLGADAGDCTVEADCDGRPTGQCEADEEGAWVCVQGGCVWNCTLPTAPDAGVVVDGDGGVVVVPDAGAPGDDAGGGCGCRQSGPHGSLPLLTFVLFGGLFWLARRRRFRSR